MNDPWVYECTGNRHGLHNWKRRTDKTAYCLNCGTELNTEQAERVFYVSNEYKAVFARNEKEFPYGK